MEKVGSFQVAIAWDEVFVEISGEARSLWRALEGRSSRLKKIVVALAFGQENASGRSQVKA